MKLKFAKGNAKLSKQIAIFSLPAGHTCCGARDCLAKVNRITGKLSDGPDTKFRCYATAAEYMFPNVRKGRWDNFDMLRACKTSQDMADLICASLPKGIKLCRIHQSGDFFNQTYFDAWLIVAVRNPQIVFYGYTKALPFWVNHFGDMPDNFKLVASIGGKFDSMIAQYGLRTSTVVFSKAEAKAKGLKIDHDDSLLYGTNDSFALLLHGAQPAKSPASKALAAMRAKGRTGYHTDYFGHYNKVKADSIPNVAGKQN